MPFGCYKDTPMWRVPAKYLDWLHGQRWINEWPAVLDYIERNRHVIDWELEKGE